MSEQKQIKNKNYVTVANAPDYSPKKLSCGEIYRVTGGKGGEALLILGSEKTALYDTGMACFGDALLSNMEAVLAGRPLDYVLISHIHYDHIGALPYVMTAHPEAVICSGQHGYDTLPTPAKYVQIRQLGEEAGKCFLGDSFVLREYEDSVWRVDRVLHDEETISLGNLTVRVYETPGHTRESLSFYIPEYDALIASETTGVWDGGGRVIVPFLTGYKASVQAIHRMEKLSPGHLISPHFLELSESEIPSYFRLGLEFAESYKSDVIRVLMDSALSDEERIRKLAEKYWTGSAKEEQPYPAFVANATAQLALIRQEFLSE